MLHSDRTKNLIAVEPKVPQQEPWHSISKDTAYSIAIPLAIALLSAFATLWLYSKFVSKDKYVEDQRAIAKRFDILEKSTDRELDSLKITVAGFSSTVQLILAKIEAFTTIVQNIQESQDEKFNRLRADNIAFQDSTNDVIKELSKEIRITNRGLETMNSRLDRLKYEVEEAEK